LHKLPQLSTAATELAKARVRLQAHFPSLALQVQPPSALLSLSGEPGAWREQILAESDELRIAREELRQSGLLAAGRQNTVLTQRAYTLGEADLQTLSLARRQAVDALRPRYRLLVDAH
jgi:hypothetical protein